MNASTTETLERRDLKVLLPLLPHWLSDSWGAPWGQKWEVHTFPGPMKANDQSLWFSTSAISHSRDYRSTSCSPPLNCQKKQAET